MAIVRKVLVTGAAGFIGSHVARRLLDAGSAVVGLDNLNDYYDVTLKQDRLKHVVGEHDHFKFVKLELADQAAMAALFEAEGFDAVVHLAAQAGVRYSLENPQAYVDSNVTGTLNIFEGCRNHPVSHCVFASSSSVYGANASMPFSVHQNVDHPMSMYAATKKSCELMGHAYSQLYDIPITGLRFFTVYGPWGRPDMAAFLFTKAMLAGEPIQVFNRGEMQRDFTYIDDIVEGVVRLVDHPPQPNADWDRFSPDPGTSFAPYAIQNIGNHSPVRLMHFIETLEKELGIEADKELLPMQPGDVPATYADVQALQDSVGFSPDTSIEEGLRRFVAWYRAYYSVG